MRYDFKLISGALRKVSTGEGNIVIYSNPTTDERQEILATLPIAVHTLDSMLDPDEISRTEFSPECEVLIWKRALARTDGHPFEITSVGLVRQKDRLTIIERDHSNLQRNQLLWKAESLSELLIRGIQLSVAEFVSRLREVKRIAVEIEKRLTRTIDNSELLRMFDLSESLVFTVDAIDANATVLARFRSIAQRLGLTEHEIDFLDDVIIDNAQCSRQGHIYITVFSGLMDARGNVINNNMNVLLKNLTIVNVVFLPLSIIAGMGGMSEFSTMIQRNHIDIHVGYALFTFLMAALGLVIWIVLRSWINRTFGPDGSP